MVGLALVGAALAVQRSSGGDLVIEPRRYWVDSKARLRQVADEVVRLDVGVGRVAEIIIRPARREKSTAQRGLFHSLLAEFALHYGIAPREAKEWFKLDYYGEDSKKVRIRALDKNGRRQWRTFVIKTVQSTEDEDGPGYGRLIDYLYLWAAEKEIVLTERRPPANYRSE